jgi:putative membrane protein
MQGLMTRWALSAASLGIVAWLLPGIEVGEGFDALVSLFVGAALLGLVNVLVKPVLVLLSCPLILVSLGLFLFVINAGLLLLASQLSGAFGKGFSVAGWPSAIVGSILLTIVSWLLNAFVRDDHKKEQS